MGCTCGACTPDRLAGEPGRTLSRVMSEALDHAEQLIDAAGRMKELAHSVGCDPANPISTQSFNRLIRWAQISDLAAARIRELVSETCQLAQEVI